MKGHFKNKLKCFHGDRYCLQCDFMLIYVFWMGRGDKKSSMKYFLNVKYHLFRAVFQINWIKS